ncbi:TonB-dependent receptor [Sphingobium indicum]|nr:TonB-dependent receptor [Sphingobium indicum]
MYISLLCATSALCGPSEAFAQTANTNPSTDRQQTAPVVDLPTSQVDDIVVTAQRRSQSVSDVPMSITAVSGEQMKDMGISNVADLVKLTPGLSYVESGASTPVFSLRGVGFFDTSIGARPTVSVYVDQIPLPFSIMTSGASFDLQRVEVLKGPQGTLFGANSTGGAINYVANVPTDRFAASTTLGYGNFDAFSGEGFVSGPITDTLGVRLAVKGEKTGPWQRSYTRDAELGDRRFVQGRFITDWRPSSSFEVTLSLSGFLDRSDTPAAQLIQFLPQRAVSVGKIPLVANYPLAPADNSAADWNDEGFPLRKHNSFYQGALRGTWNLNDRLKLISITSYSDIDIHQRVDLDATSVAAVFSDNTGSASSLAQEVRLQGDYNRAALVIGASYSKDRSTQVDDYQLPYSTGTYSIPTGLFNHFLLDSRQRFDTKAVFANIDNKLTDTLTLTAGARYTRADLDYSACSRVGNDTTAATLTAFFNILRRPQPGIAPLVVGQCLTLDATTTPALVKGKLNQDNVSWRIGFDWKPAPRTLLYGNISQGYKAGSGPVVPALAANQLTPVSQESVRAYEVGFRTPIIGRALDASGAVFYYDYRNKQLKSRTQVEPSVLGALEALVNVPRSRIVGMELALNAHPMTGLTLTVAGTYIASKVTGAFSGYTITGQLASFKDEAFPYTPKYQVSGQGRYEWSLSETLNAFFGASVNYRSGTTSGFGNLPILDIASYALVDLQSGVATKNGNWKVLGYVRNLTNEYYATNVARINDTVRRFAGMPRTYGIQLTRNF